MVFLIQVDLLKVFIGMPIDHFFLLLFRKVYETCSLEWVLLNEFLSFLLVVVEAPHLGE